MFLSAADIAVETGLPDHTVRLRLAALRGARRVTYSKKGYSYAYLDTAVELVQKFKDLIKPKKQESEDG